MSTTAATQQLSVKRIATFQVFPAPLVFLSDTAQQTALPLMEALAREALHQGMSIVAVCADAQLSSDIMTSSTVSAIDCRLPLDRIVDGASADRGVDFVSLGQTIQQAIVASIGRSTFGLSHQLSADRDGGDNNVLRDNPSSKIGESAGRGGVLVVFDSLEMLLRTSTVDTLALLRTIRQKAPLHSNFRILARFPRDIFQRRAETSSASSWSGSPSLYNTLNSIADAIIDIYPLDALPRWMPGWYSNEEAMPFVSLNHNDSRRGLLRMEHRKQSGKIGMEVASFDIDERLLPVFRTIEISPSSTVAPLESALIGRLPQSSNKDKQSGRKESGSNDAKPANAVASKNQPDPTSGLSFNLNLTEKQRKDKANVELPYLEAQLDTQQSFAKMSVAESKHSGGEIHYQLDETDDWDEEDDLDDDLEI
ncbi:hypothetical protein H4S06_001679 [Coemansia sp. BCRC 34490]|nr:hypothetical protein H4S06_001679 [Coemansia sp. BCRC 34490]